MAAKDDASYDLSRARASVTGQATIAAYHAAQLSGSVKQQRIELEAECTPN